ncbi:unnamed protein product [Nippostrongylus brasiliensis]|uniref:Nucleolar protein 10 n=1 Tax=Nippostrongylus brasiliensis TaxID=27835 RepID=A0A0N4YHX3_NIPBR|nr:unnamed protein product [Nippostrongylus brasiliensis]
MQVASINDVKIYNLSAGKSIPELIFNGPKNEEIIADVRRRVQLIQDFDMPDVSHTIDVSRDGRYVFATAVIKMISLAEDYSKLKRVGVKLILLQEDRFLEMHAAFGRYFRMRMPRFGRDMAFSFERSDLFLVGASSEVYHLNLELGEWLSPLQSNSSGLNCCQFAEPHQLFVCGTTDGQVEAWDHRDKSRVGVLNCLPYLQDQTSTGVEITSLQFRDALRLGVGTSSGHVMIYDIRSQKPLIVKDHINGLPIKRIDFALRESENRVLSMDSRVLKIWDENDGKPFAAIETESGLNNFCRYPDSGLILLANEAPRMQQFFIPALGPAPKWCYYLEALTEELEETQQATIYDDYKFVTKEELDQLSLSHLVGSSVLRAYMHGYFIDRRLYDKAQLITQPFAYEKYKERKIQDLMHQEREHKVIATKDEKNQPKVNKELAARLLAEAAAEQADDKSSKKRKKSEKKKVNGFNFHIFFNFRDEFCFQAETASAILQDDRFQKLFADEDFEVDQTSEQFKRSAIVQHKEALKSKNTVQPDEQDENEDDELIEQSELPPMEDGMEAGSHRNGSVASGSDSSSDTDEESLTEKKRREKERAKRKQEIKERHKQQYQEKILAREAERAARLVNKPKKFVLHELESTDDVRVFLDEHVKEAATAEESVTLAEKKAVMEQKGDFEEHEEIFGGRQMTFSIAKRGASAREARAEEEKKKHKKERRATVREPTTNIKRTLKRLPGKLSKH